MSGGNFQELWRDVGVPSVEPLGAVRSRKDGVAGRLGGFLNRRVGADVVSEPVLPRNVVDVVQELARDGEAGQLERLTEAWPGIDWYRKTHKVVRGASGRLEGVMRYPGLSEVPVAELSVDAEAAVRESVQHGREAAVAADQRRIQRELNRKKMKTYDIGAFFHDLPVMTKFSVDAGYLAIVQREALLDVGKACVLLQRYLRVRGHEVEVRPGGYASGPKAARKVLVTAAVGCVATAVMGKVAIVGDSLYIESADTSGGVAEWTVSGPMRLAVEVRAVAALAASRGVLATVTLFGIYLARLGVDLVEAHPSVGMADSHAGFEPLSPVGKTVERVGVYRCLVSVSGANGLGGFGTAVRHTGTSAVVNQHVYKEAVDTGGALLLDRVPVEFKRELVSDLCLVECVPGVVEGVLSAREARLGEKATLYCALEDPTVVEETGRVVVTAVEHGAVMSTVAQYARKGCSGGALLADADGALLGYYYGSSKSHSTYIPAADVASVVGGSSAGPSPVTPRSDFSFSDASRRGLDGRVREVVASLVPFEVDGESVGCGVATWSGVLSGVEPALWKTGLAVLPNVVPETVGPRGVYSYEVRGAVPFEGKVREPRIGETANVFVKTGTDAVFASKTVEFVAGGDGLSYMDYPGRHVACSFLGGAVVAASDGYVLGLCVGESQGPQGAVLKVAHLPAAAFSARAALLKTSPTGGALNFRLWDELLCRSVLGKGEVPVAELASKSGDVLVRLGAESLLESGAGAEWLRGVHTSYVEAGGLSSVSPYGALAALVGGSVSVDGVEDTVSLLGDMFVGLRRRTWSVGSPAIAFGEPFGHAASPGASDARGQVGWRRGSVAGLSVASDAGG